MSTEPSIPTTPAAHKPSGAAIEAHLRSLAGQARAQLLLQRSGRLLAGSIAILLIWGFLDFWLRFPTPIRFIAWALGLGTLAWQTRKHLLPAWKFRPSATALALRIESATGTDVGLRDLLASGLELAQPPKTETAGPVELSLRNTAAAAAQSRFAPVRSKTKMLRPDRLMRVLASLVAVAVPILALQFAAPGLARIGTLRVLTPWTNTTWPKRTGVADANPVIAHALGAPIALRAVSFRKGGQGGDISVEYRSVINTLPGPWRRAILSKQNKRISVSRPGGGDPVEGPLHELLLETTSLATANEARAPSEAVLEYRFKSADDETALWSTRLILPPAILAATVSATPPEYATHCPANTTTSASKTALASESGSEFRIRADSVLAGSTLRLDLVLNRPMPLPESAEGRAELLRSTFPTLAQVPDLQITSPENGATNAWSLRWTALASISSPIILKDSFGIRSTSEPLLDVDVTEDRPPRPAIIDPPQDESVLPTAIITVAAESRDDVGLASLDFYEQQERRPADSPGAPAEPQGEPSLAPEASRTSAGCDLRLETSRTYDIATLNLNPGDALVLTARSSDLRLVGSSAPAVVSAPRRLRIISESNFTEELQNELASMRDAAARLRKEQGDVSAQRPLAAESSKSAADSASRQQAVADRIDPLTQLGDRLKARIARNRPTDSSLAQTVNDADELAKEAAAAADAAAEALEQLADDPSEEDRPALAERTATNQATTEDALDELVAMLDQGREGHAAKRTVEKLLTEQRQATTQTANAAAQTQGKSPESLSPTERQELDRLAAKQQSLSQRTQAALDALEQQAEQLKPSDPGQAQAMKSAAEKGRESRAAGQQQQAAEQIQQNQTGQAQEKQKKAEEALEEMLNELNKTQQRRDDALRRLLAEIGEELERLVTLQEGELNNASTALVAPPAASLDPAMIDLNRATIAVAARITKEMRSAGELPQLIDSAVAAQAAAIAVLRAEPPDFGEAITSEQRSLSRLREAIDELERLQEKAEEKEQDRKRRELLKQYQAALESQVAIKAEVVPFQGKTLTRKDRAVFRISAQTQEDLRLSLVKMREDTSELEAAQMFSFAHDRLDAVMIDVVARLNNGDTTPSLDSAQASAVRMLAALVDALKPLPDEDDGLKQDEEGAGGEGGGGGSMEPPLIPPIAELKLLRSMQQEAFELTRDAAKQPDAAAVATAAELQSALAKRAAAIQEALEKAEQTPAITPELVPDEPPNPEPQPPAPKEEPQ